MRRPVGVSITGCYCLIAGVYLCSIATLMLVMPSVIPALRKVPFVHALRLISPYATLVVGIVWALIAWGLFRMRDWARFTAMLLLGIGVPVEASMLVFQKHSTWLIVVACVDIVLRASAALYLVLPGTIDIFQQQSPGLKPNVPTTIVRP